MLPNLEDEVVVCKLQPAVSKCSMDAQEEEFTQVARVKTDRPMRDASNTSTANCTRMPIRMLAKRPTPPRVRKRYVCESAPEPEPEVFALWRDRRS
jgi:hypothetical protein